MKSINKFFAITALVMTVLFFASITIGYAYISTHKDIWDNLNNVRMFDGRNFNFNFDGERSSTFETLTTTNSQNFDLVDALVIDVAVDKVTFIQEERNDILVDYYNEHPDSPLYDVTYYAEAVDGLLSINSTYSVSNLFIDKTYESTITIHVPNDYECNTFDLTMSMGEITNESIFDGARNVTVHSNLGSVDFEVTTPKDSLSVTCDMGDIDITVSAPVKSLDAKTNFGEMTLNLNDNIGTLWADLDMGSLYIDAQGTIDTVNMTAKMGSIDCIYKERVNKLTADANMGSIHVDFGNNEDSTVYVDANAGSIDSDLPVVKESSDPDFRFYANMGSIDITTH